MIEITSSGSTKNTENFLKAMEKFDVRNILTGLAQQGVEALSAATPVRTGLAAGSWGYTVEKTKGGWAVTWTNTDIESGFPVAVMIQYGYGTGTGGYVEGIDYINPALRPVFDRISEQIWKAVKSA